MVSLSILKLCFKYLPGLMVKPEIIFSFYIYIVEWMIVIHFLANA